MSPLQQLTAREVRHGSVTTGHPEFLHDTFWQQTGLRVYPAFMAGGGYVVSQDVASLVMRAVKASQTDIFAAGPEDASFGFYASFIKLRRINNLRFW